MPVWKTGLSLQIKQCKETGPFFIHITSICIFLGNNMKTNESKQ